MIRSLTIAALLVAAAGVALAADVAGRASVIDGDTIEIHGQRIRLHGIDAPEGAQRCYRDEQLWPCGRRAAFALAHYIGSRTVRCEPRERDRYGRIRDGRWPTGAIRPLTRTKRRAPALIGLGQETRATVAARFGVDVATLRRALQ